MELLAAETPIVVPQWCDFSLTLPAIGISVAGYTWLSQVRLAKGDVSVSPLAAFTVTVVDSPSGLLSIGLTNAQVATMYASAIAAKAPVINGNTQLVCYWDIVGTLSSVKTRYFQGPALLSLGVSH